jgi:8-amino-7-oxononanoate synthase
MMPLSDHGKTLEGGNGTGLHQSADMATPILPWWVGEAEKAVQLSQALMDRGFFVPAIRYPTVPPNTSRLRITLSASHSTTAIKQSRETISSLP